MSSAEDECPYESNQCYFVYCHDVSEAKTGHFAEWGCVDKNPTDFCEHIFPNAKEKHFECICVLGDLDAKMGNERETFDGHKPKPIEIVASNPYD